ncbi:MAG: hypothetical protein KC561_12240, partial [Myxococcales bacterium]|nr:hypothetical protein [Myxococcales bacterium]
SASGNGGAVQSTANTVVRDSNFFDNLGQIGGALQVANVGTGQDILQVYDTTFNSNYASYAGGAVRVYGDSHFERVSFHRNEATGSAEGGGAIRIAGGNSTVINATFAENYADRHGPAIHVNSFAAGTVLVRHITARDNIVNSPVTGSAVVELNQGSPATLNLGNSILINDTTNCYGVTSQSYNQSSDASCNPISGDISNNNGGLEDLASEDGSVIYPMKSGSIAINQGLANCPDLDQLGYARDTPCDIGAVEFQSDL